MTTSKATPVVKMIDRTISGFWLLTNWLVLAVTHVGFVYIFALGVWAAAGKLHVLPRQERLSLGLLAGVLVVAAFYHLRGRREADEEWRTRKALEDAYKHGYRDAKDEFSVEVAEFD